MKLRVYHSSLSAPPLRGAAWFRRRRDAPSHAPSPPHAPHAPRRRPSAQTPVAAGADRGPTTDPCPATGRLAGPNATPAPFRRRPRAAARPFRTGSLPHAPSRRRIARLALLPPRKDAPSENTRENTFSPNLPRLHDLAYLPYNLAGFT